MTKPLSITFSSLDGAVHPTIVLLAGKALALGAVATDLNKKSEKCLSRSAEAADFTGRARSTLEILAPAGLKPSRIIIAGTGNSADQSERDWQNLGGVIMAAIAARKAKTAGIVVELPDDDRISAAKVATDVAAVLAMGALLRSYEFDKYRTRVAKKRDGDTNAKAGKTKVEKLVIHCADPKAAEKAFARCKAVADGIMTARDLVNEPANKLGPVEFAAHAKALSKLGVKVEILVEKDLKKEKMGALLAVGQGSERPSRVAVMRWRGGADKDEPPLCFVGKGVVFDTGGISMKPAAGMEAMKGDMGGAACVVGLIQALAGRRAKVNAVGIIGLVENMPSGEATRPGDIVKSKSGRTIEVLNTDAEGRLVLADLLSYAQERFKPKFIIDLATLTGAIMVALGREYAGLFSNNDALAEALTEAGEATGEKVWRMPLGPGYDKMIDSKNADVKNLGGRYGGASTAAQFLARFIEDEDLPWAHLDIAGTAMASPNSHINRSWGSGWGVMLLDCLVAEKYED